MASYQIRKLLNEVHPWSLADGTLAPIFTPPWGPICAASPLYPTNDLRASSAKKKEPDLGFLFNQCLNPKTGLSEDDYSKAATALGIEVAAIKAVAEVESKGDAFDRDGRPTILFERHYFHRLTGGKFDAKYADISSQKSGGYGKFSAQYGKLERAYALDRDAALRSASWGMFQIMGDNFQAAGFTSASEFVLALTKSQAAHLKAFVTFVGNDRRMVNALHKKDWAHFAAAYNGSGYKKNAYDTKMKEAYDKFSH